MLLFAIGLVLATLVVRAQVEPIVDTDKLALRVCALIDCRYLPSFGRPLVDTAVESLLPDLFGTYNEFDGNEIHALAATLNQDLPIPMSRRKLLDTVFYGIQCYEEAGAIRWRLYQHWEDQRIVGAVVAINEYEFFNLDTLMQCVTSYLRVDTVKTSGGIPEPINLCFGTYRYTKIPELIHYRIAYFATQRDTCLDFCAALTSCDQTAIKW